MSDTTTNNIHIEIFSDVLCVWAYSAQIRFDQLKRDFGDQLQLQYRYIPIFAAVEKRIGQGWKDKGGFAGFNENLHKTAAGWDHVELHPKIWLQNVPKSSTVPHLYLKAVQLLQEQHIISAQALAKHDGHSLFEAFSWHMRCAFFKETQNIGEMSVLDTLAEDMGIPVMPVHERLDNGEAHAALQLDIDARDQYRVPGSPTLVFNDGRQRLYGNVGYRIIEANIRELLNNGDSGEASWC